jgi:hypothetical protein
MNKEQKNAEQHIRIMKYNCEMRAKSVELATTLSTSKTAESLLENADQIAKYVFGVATVPPKEK